MKIAHDPQFDVDKITQHYTEKDGVPVKYVCTSDLNASDVPVDVYYRATPHPKFGNKYFGLYYDHIRDHMMITNADLIEDLTFGLVQGDDGAWHYSQSHHDFKQFENGNMIDGGRVYIRSSGPVAGAMVIDGELSPINEETEYYYPGQDPQE